MAGLERWGTDIFVSGLGEEPHVTKLADGRFVVTWVDNQAQEVRGQILNADGSLRGGQFTVNSNPAGEQLHPNVTALADGRFVVVWTDQSAPAYDDNTGELGGHYADVFGQVFNIDGTKSGAAFKVNEGVPPTHGLHQPGVTALSDGGFAVTWRDYLTPNDQNPGDYSSAEVWLARFDGNGTKVLAPKLIQDSRDYGNVEPVVQALNNGNLVAVWSQGTETSEVNLFGRIVDANGNTVAELGDIGAAYDGVPDVVQITPEITKLKDGGFVVTWKVQDGSTGAQDYAVWARVFNQDGSARSAAFNVSPPNNVEVDPVVTALNDGRFMIAWADYHSYSSLSTEVKGQIYTSAGVADGNAVTMHTPHGVNDRMPSITTLADGRVAVSWWHDGEPTVRAQIMDSREAAIDLSAATLGEVATAFDNDWVGTRFGDKFDGGKGNDQFEGGAGADAITGGDGFDTVTFAHAAFAVSASMYAGLAGEAAGDTYGSVERLIGSNFDDVFIGNGSAVLQAGAGNDRYFVSGNDRVVEAVGGGHDTVVFSGNYQLDASAEVEVLLVQGSGNISLTGNAFANTMLGNKGKDRLDGQGGNDRLAGGYGNDVLTGGAGQDAFVFDAKLGTSSTDRKVNFDTVRDYSVRDDKIQVDGDLFKKNKDLYAAIKKGTENKPLKLASKFFSLNKATDEKDYFIYNEKTRVLSYDADGSGSKAAVEIATFTKNAALKKFGAGEIFFI